MVDFQANTQPYDLGAVHADDRQESCITITVGHHEHGMPVASLEHLDREVDLFMTSDKKHVTAATKLYVLGVWNYSFDIGEAAAAAAAAQDEASDDPWIIVPQLDERTLESELGLTETKERNVTRQELEWNKGVAKICDLIREMNGLKELTWISMLPFTEAVWGVLPTTNIEKLVIDIGKPVRLESIDFNRETYIGQDSMKALVNFVKLKELRIFNMRDSFQSIIWETVFRNEADNKGMSVLDLQMAAPPLVRQENWVKAEHVLSLSVPVNADDEYLGIDGKGILHHVYGTGEYLDDFCMRKARLASNLNYTKPLPLWCLRLDGFVVDQLPFGHELSRIVLLTCGRNCVDAGLRAPKIARPHDKWYLLVKDVVSHCRIDFPNWTGIFDAGGLQRDKDEDLAVHKQLEKNDQDASTLWLETGGVNSLSLEGTPLIFPGAEIPISPGASNAAVRGSPVPTCPPEIFLNNPYSENEPEGPDEFTPGKMYTLTQPDGSADLDTITDDGAVEQHLSRAASNSTTAGFEILVPNDISEECDLPVEPKNDEA